MTQPLLMIQSLPMIHLLVIQSLLVIRLLMMQLLVIHLLVKTWTPPPARTPVPGAGRTTSAAGVTSVARAVAARAGLALTAGPRLGRPAPVQLVPLTPGVQVRLAVRAMATQAAAGRGLRKPAHAPVSRAMLLTRAPLRARPRVKAMEHPVPVRAVPVSVVPVSVVLLRVMVAKVMVAKAALVRAVLVKSMLARAALVRAVLVKGVLVKGMPAGRPGAAGRARLAALQQAVPVPATLARWLPCRTM